jgi:NarL family two-component system response regulator LiaR
VVLMDVGMPGMDGIEATQAIKATTPEIRVMVLTSHTHEPEIIAALSSGADAYCIEDTNVDALANAIIVFLGALSAPGVLSVDGVSINSTG